MNKLIPIILVIVCLIVGGIGWLSINRDETAVPTSAAPTPPPLPEGRTNSPAVTQLSEAATYTSQFKGTTAEVQKYRSEMNDYFSSTDRKVAEATQKALERAIPELEKRLRESIRKADQGQLNQPTSVMTLSESNRVLPTQSRSGQPTANEPGTLSSAAGSSRILDPGIAGVPKGFGFDNLDATGVRLPGSSQTARLLPTTARDSSTSIQRPGFVKISAWQPVQMITKEGITNAAFPESGVVDKRTNASGKSKAEKPKPVPVYTIENTSTLFSNTTMTALMGVVPGKNNSIKNLMRFKLITGAENIASNGLYLPDVRNVVWTGYAIGNREMQCVQATIDTVTYTFQDGTIRTVRKRQKGSGGQLGEGLGYLSDRWGKPCIAGTLIDNATQYLRDRTVVAAAAGGAAAAAAMQTETIRDTSGGISTAVTGSQGEYIAGQTGTALLNELAAYLRDRMDQVVDIVYLDAGKDVVIHVEEEIPIDYDPAGRKLAHIALAQKAQMARLD